MGRGWGVGKTEEKEVRQFCKAQPGMLALPNWPNDLLSSKWPLPWAAFPHPLRKPSFRSQPAFLRPAGWVLLPTSQAEKFSWKSRERRVPCSGTFHSSLSVLILSLKPGWDIGLNLGKYLIIFLRNSMMEPGCSEGVSGEMG